MNAKEKTAELEEFKLIVAARLGLRFDDNKTDFLVDVLRQRAAVCGAPEIRAYLHQLEDNTRELRCLAEQLTVGETFFFRHDEHLKVLQDVILPAWLQEPAPRRPLRILSAGCASGEEPYSIAIGLHGLLCGNPALAAVQITGIDINPAAIEKARHGCYSTWSLRQTARDIRERYFTSAGNNFVLAQEIRAMVSFEERNLTRGDLLFWRENIFDVVFCRNVTMYFVPDAARTVIERIHRAMALDGYLFLGHAETLRGLSQDFHLRHTHGAFYYRKRSDARPYGPCADQPPTYQHLESVVSLSTNAASWYDIIQQASQRIAALTATESRVAPDNQNVVNAPPAEPVTRASLEETLDLLRQERFGDAMNCLQTLPGTQQANSDAQLLLAVILTNNGKLDEAEQVCRGLLRDDELNAGAHFLMSLCREHVGDRPMAREHAHTAIYLDATFALPHLHLGLMARRENDLATARRELHEALMLLEREDAARILLFGGGFSRGSLVALCRAELAAVEKHAHER